MRLDELRTAISNADLNDRFVLPDDSGTLPVISHDSTVLAQLGTDKWAIYDIVDGQVTNEQSFSHEAGACIYMVYLMRRRYSDRFQAERTPPRPVTRPHAPVVHPTSRHAAVSTSRHAARPATHAHARAGSDVSSQASVDESVFAVAAGSARVGRHARSDD